MKLKIVRVNRTGNNLTVYLESTAQFSKEYGIINNKQKIFYALLYISRGEFLTNDEYDAISKGIARFELLTINDCDIHTIVELKIVYDYGGKFSKEIDIE
jgi:hypothetical protein